MAWTRRWWGQTRRSLRALDRLATAVEAQTALLARIADTVAPLQPTDLDTRDTGATFIDDQEQARILDFVQRSTRATGRTPTDDEVVQWLADEATAAVVRERS